MPHLIGHPYVFKDSIVNVAVGIGKEEDLHFLAAKFESGKVTKFKLQVAKWQGCKVAEFFLTSPKCLLLILTSTYSLCLFATL
jgi:hypothetical protein